MKKKNLILALFIMFLGFGFMLNVHAEIAKPQITAINMLSTQIRVNYKLSSCGEYKRCGIVLVNRNWYFRNDEAIVLRAVGDSYKTYDGLNKGETYAFVAAVYWFDDNDQYHMGELGEPITIKAQAPTSKTPTNLEIVTAPTKTEYIEGETFDPTGMKLKVTYNIGDSTEIQDGKGCTFSPNKVEKDTTQIRVTCEGVYATQSIKVTQKTIEEITEITSKPNKVIYEDGEYFDPAGMKIKVKYSDNSTEEVEVTKDICKFIPDKLTVGTDKVTIECGNTQTNVDVTVKEKEKTLENISIKTEATKKEYIEGEKFNSDGMIITYKYSDGTTVDANVSEEVSNNKCTIDPSGELSKNDTKVTITCDGKSVDQNITVTSKELEKIEVVSPPNKVNYMEGENFDPTGLKIKATYSNGSSDEILDGKGCEFAPSDSLKTDDKSVTVTCNGKSTTLDIVVNAKSVEVNAPVLSDNMIPVYYDSENNMWRKANINNEKTKITYILGDVNGDGKVNASDANQIKRYISESSSVLYDNPWALYVADVNRDGRINDEDASLVGALNKEYQIGEEQTEVIDTTWYDYGKKKWANAVTVSDTSRDRYLIAEVGQEIKMNDILTMQVWIPRYKYKVWNYNSDGNKTSTPKEVEIVWEKGIEKAGNITCSDNVSGSENDASEVCKANNAVCTDETCNNEMYTHPAFTLGDEELAGIWVGKFETTGTIDNITVKPNSKSLTNQSVSSFASKIMGMKNANNQYGFSSSVDVHMAKNIDWGAIAYLSHSKYGRCDGDTCEEITMNNCSNKITGIGADTVSASSSTATCSSNANKYNGEKGMLASTTGNVYGIYDMNGGSYEYVMANMVDTDKNMVPGYSGYTTTSYPNAKYYDRYSYSTSANSRVRSKLGDATKEVYVSDNNGWYLNSLSLAKFDYPWILRGGHYNDSPSGIFHSVTNNGGTYDNNSTRIVMTNDIESSVFKIKITNEPNKTSYVEGQDFDPTGMKIEAKYYNGNTTEISDGEGCIFTPSTNLVAGTSKVRVTCMGKNADLDISVSEKVISKIEKKESPSKTVYVVGEKFDATGMILNVTYNDDSSKEIVVSDEIANGKCSIDPSGELTTDVTSVKVTCGGFDVMQDITVKQEAVVDVVVQNGTVSTPSKKVDYNTDAVFDIVPMDDSYVYGYVSCTNDQIASYNDKVLTVRNLNSDTTCTLKLTNEITSLYEDGTLIINEQGLDKASNLEKHGKVVNSYDAMNDDNVYSFNATSQIWKSERDLIKSVEIGKTLKPTVTSYWFYDLRNLEKVDLTNLDTSKVTSMYGMFKYAGYDVSNFSLNLASLDTSSVETIQDMFMYAGYNADVFNLNLSSWNLSNLKNMGMLFMYAGYNATTWNVGDLSKWNTSNVTDMSSAFKYAGANATIWNIGDLSGWDTTKVSYMRSMFEGAGMNVGTFKDIGNLKISSGCNVSNFAGNSPKFRGNVTIYGSLTGDDSMFKYSDYSSTQYYGVTDSSSYANIYYANDDAKVVVESILSNKKSNQNIYNKGLRTE